MHHELQRLYELIKYFNIISLEKNIKLLCKTTLKLISESFEIYRIINSIHLPLLITVASVSRNESERTHLPILSVQTLRGHVTNTNYKVYQYYYRMRNNSDI